MFFKYHIWFWKKESHKRVDYFNINLSKRPSLVIRLFHVTSITYFVYHRYFLQILCWKNNQLHQKKFKILCTIIQITIMQSQALAYNCFIKWFVNIFECLHSCNCHSLCHHKVWTIALKFIFCTFPMWKYFLFCPCNHMIVYTQWKSGKWYVLRDSDILFK